MKVNTAVAQIRCVLDDPAANLAHCLDTLRAAAAEGVELVVFPECILTGYMFESLVEARKAGLDTDGAELTAIADECGRLGTHCVVGFLETLGPDLYNSAALVAPDGPCGIYRKSHLPWLGADRHATPGAFDEPPVFDTDVGRIGLAICFDLRFPESARTLALAGAEIVAHPTSSPVQSHVLFDHFSRVRACENRVFLLLANRPDEERGTQFLGRSQIVDPSGAILAEAGDHEAILTATVDTAEARDKSIVVDEGRFELPLFEARRPELYRSLTEHHDQVARA
jgi:predicted amidohydrolase